MLNLSDNQLLELFRSGNRTGFEMLYNRYWKILYHIAARIVNNTDVAKDIVQEVFLSFYERASSAEITNVRSYIFQAVKYKCFMHLRSGHITERHLRRVNLVASANLVDDELQAMELQQMLDHTIASLPEKCREVFYLSRFEMQSNRAIAEKLNISTKTVEHQITKALKALRMSVDKIAVLVSWLHFS